MLDSTTADTTSAAPELLVRPKARERSPGFFSEMGHLVEFTVQAVACLPGSARYAAETLRHAATMARTTMPLLLLMTFFMGIVTMNTGYFLLFPLGAADYLGAIVGFGTHVSPVMMFAFVFTAKVGGGFAAEIGAMRVNQEIDAYESTGVDPLRFVVGTRLLATLLVIPISTLVALVGYYLGCYVDAIAILSATDFGSFSRFAWSSHGLRDLVFVFTTIAINAVATAMVACFYGMRTAGGPTAVGTSVAKATKVNLVLCNIVMAVTVLNWYAIDAGVPIGG